MTPLFVEISKTRNHPLISGGEETMVTQQNVTQIKWWWWRWKSYMAWCVSAWWPGGLTIANPFFKSPLATLNPSSMTHPAAYWDKRKLSIKTDTKDFSTATSQKGKSQNGCYKKTKHAKFSEKQTFFTPYQGVRNVCFLENLTYFVFLYHPFWDLPFCFVTDNLVHFFLMFPFTSMLPSILQQQTFPKK